MEYAKYEELFENKYVNEAIGREKFYEFTYPIISKKNRNIKSSMIKNTLNVGNRFIFKNNVLHKNLLIMDFKFIKIIREQSEKFNFYVIDNSINDFRKFRKEKNINIYFSNKWESMLDKSFFSKNMIYANEAISQIRDYMTKKKIQMLMLGNDKIFIEKALVIAAKSLGIPVVILQHGAYNLDSFEKLKTANAADYFWTWSQHIADMYCDFYKKEKETTRVMGYPFELPQNVKSNKTKILFLGNQYANFNEEEGNGYKEIAKKVHQICVELNLTFVYRPHPAELIDETYEEFYQPQNESKTLMEDLSDSFIVVGDISSAMIEAGLIGKMVIQVIWSERSKVALKDHMYDFTYKVDDDINQIKQQIQEMIGKREICEINSYYLFNNKKFKNDIQKFILEQI